MHPLNIQIKTTEFLNLHLYIFISPCTDVLNDKMQMFPKVVLVHGDPIKIFCNRKLTVLLKDIFFNSINIDNHRVYQIQVSWDIHENSISTSDWELHILVWWLYLPLSGIVLICHITKQATSGSSTARLGGHIQNQVQKFSFFTICHISFTSFRTLSFLPTIHIQGQYCNLLN